MASEARTLSESGLAERRLTAEHVIARALVEASTFADAVPKILAAICKAFGWEHAALWEIDQQAARLQCRQIWSAEGTSFPDFDAASRAISFERGAGLPGRVWATEKMPPRTTTR